MDDHEIAAPDLITPPADATSFEAGGVAYTQTDGLSVARQRVFQRLQIEFAQDTGYRDYVAALDALTLALNKTDFIAAAALVQRQRDGVKIIGQGRLRDVEIAALFFNAPGEDAGAYDFAAMNAKCYTAWGAVHSGFFMRAALNLLPTGYGSAYPFNPLVEELQSDEPTP